MLMHLSAIAGEPDSRANTGQEDWLLCHAGSSHYALPLGNVVEIMRVLPIEPIADAPLYVLGLSIIRGTPALVIDVALMCGGHTAPFHQFITTTAGRQIVALAVNRVLGVRSIKAGAPLPPLLREAASGLVSTIGRLDAELLLFLSKARIVPDELLDRFNSHETLA
jgi:purine-binding chemotaxis protein CheW